MRITTNFKASVQQVSIFDAISDLFNLDIGNAQNIAQKRWCAGVKSDFTCALPWVMISQAKLREREFLNVPEIKFQRYRGRLLDATFELCYGALNLADRLNASDSIEYQNAARWWKCCAIEHVDAMLNGVGQRRTKREIEAGLAAMLTELKAGINPFNPETDPHHFNLIEVSLRIGQHFPSDNNDVRKEKKFFRDRYWKNYLDAIRRWKAFIHQDSSLKAPYLNDFGDFVAITEGKKEVKIF